MTEQPPVERPKRSRKVYVYWGVALTLLVSTAIFCWLVAWRTDNDPIEGAIDALTREKAVLSEDGAAGTSPFIENTDGSPAMNALEAMGPKAVPALIDHLDDARPTGLRGPRWGTRRVGDLCLQLLWRIAEVRDKTGAGRDLWFDTEDSPGKMKRAKRAWRWEYYRPGSLLREKNILENEGNPWF